MLLLLCLLLLLLLLQILKTGLQLPEGLQVYNLFHPCDPVVSLALQQQQQQQLLLLLLLLRPLRLLLQNCSRHNSCMRCCC